MSVNHGEAGRSASPTGATGRRSGAVPPDTALHFPPDHDDPPAPLRRDWRDTLRGATDLALLGFLTCFAALAGVTAAAAVGTASAALQQWCEYDTWPPARVTLGRFRRALLPGIPVSLLVLVVAGLLTINVRALATGVVPGGPALIALTLVLAAVAAGYAGAVIVAIGRTDGQGWRAAARDAAATGRARPGVLAAFAGVLAIGGVLSLMVLPLLAPILVGYLLFGLHAVARKLAT